MNDHDTDELVRWKDIEILRYEYDRHEKSQQTKPGMYRTRRTHHPVCREALVSKDLAVQGTDERWTVHCFHCDSVTFQPHLPTKLNKGSIVTTVRWMWIQVSTCSISQQNPKIASYSQSAPRQCVCQRIVETRMGCEFTIYIKTSWVMENLAGWSSAISSTHCN